MNYRDITDEEMSKELRDFAEHHCGEIADLAYAAGLRIAVLSARVEALEEKSED